MLHSQSSMKAFWSERILETRAWLAEGDKTLGFLVHDEAYVTALYLAPEARNRGVGKALLSKAKFEASPLRLWVFQENIRARAFYEREGFREIRRTSGENEEKLPDVLMEWTST